MSLGGIEELLWTEHNKAYAQRMDGRSWAEIISRASSVVPDGGYIKAGISSEPGMTPRGFFPGNDCSSVIRHEFAIDRGILAELGCVCPMAGDHLSL